MNPFDKALLGPLGLLPQQPSQPLPSRQGLKQPEHRLAKEPPAVVIEETEALGLMLRSRAWEKFVLSKIGREALATDALQACLSGGVAPGGMDDVAVHLQSRDKLRRDLEMELQERISFLMEQNAPISADLAAMKTSVKAPTMVEPEKAWSPFGMDPPMRG